MSIGENISKHRRRQKLTQEQLADMSGLTPNYLSKIERGVADKFSAVNLVHIAQALRVSIDDLTNNDVKTLANRPHQQELNDLLNDLDTQTSEHLSALLVELLKSANNK